MIEVRPLRRDEIAARLCEIAALRIGVFREWPYLYEGDPEYERAYLSPYLTTPDALVVGVLHQGRLVGASTALPLEAQSGNLCEPFDSRPEAAEEVLYCGESMLLPQYRNLGIGSRFFDLREQKAAELGRRHVAFCSVIRPPDHPLRPAAARNPQGLWKRRGYQPLLGTVAELEWRDRDEADDSVHRLQFWMRTLP